MSLRLNMRSIVGSVGALALGAALAVTGASAASAAEIAPGQGLVRLAHLSPDTPSADVKVSSASAAGDVIDLSGVPYGTVSDFVSVPAGTYTADMSATEDGSAILNAPITVTEGAAITVAAVGPRDEIKAVVLGDDFTAPSAGNAKVRLIQASVNAPTVDVSVADGPQIVAGAAFGTGTGYAEVPARTWTVNATPTSGTATAGSGQVELADGAVVTLLVLDNPDGSLAVRSVVDAAGAPAAVGGVQTGGGALASAAGDEQDGGSSVLTAGVVAALLGAAGVLVALRTGKRRSSR